MRVENAVQCFGVHLELSDLIFGLDFFVLFFFCLTWPSFWIRIVVAGAEPTREKGTGNREKGAGSGRVNKHNTLARLHGRRNKRAEMDGPSGPASQENRGQRNGRGMRLRSRLRLSRSLCYSRLSTNRRATRPNSNSRSTISATVPKHQSTTAPQHHNKGTHE